MPERILADDRLERNSARVTQLERPPPRGSNQRFEKIRILPFAFDQVVDGRGEKFARRKLPNREGAIARGSRHRDEPRGRAPELSILGEHNDWRIRDAASLFIA